MRTEHDYLQQVQDYQARKEHVWDWLLLAAIVLSLLLVLVTMLPVVAASRTVVLTADQETALLAATEQANERVGCTMTSCGDKVDAEGKPMIPFTVDQVLVQIVSADLANVLRNMDASVARVIDNLKALDATTLAKVLATVQNKAMKDRLQQKLTP